MCVVAELGRPSGLVTTERGERLPILHSSRLHRLVFRAFKVLIEIECTSSFVAIVVDNHCATIVGREPLLGEERRHVFSCGDFLGELLLLSQSCEFLFFAILFRKSLVGSIFSDGLVVVSGERVVDFLNVNGVMSLFQTFKLVVIVAASRGEGC